MKPTHLFFLILSLVAACTAEKEKEPTTEDQPAREIPPPVDQEADDPELSTDWETHSSTRFNFSLSYPQEWLLHENNKLENHPILNIYHAPENVGFNPPVVIHGDYAISFISILPKGYGTELPTGKKSTVTDYPDDLPVNFDIDENVSEVYLLENNEPWAFYLKPSSPPASWNNSFIYAQIKIEHPVITCYDEESGEKLPMEKCDPMMGDRIEREGNVDQAAKENIRKILRSISFSK